MSFSLCHYVILSKKSHLSPFVIMSLCLKKHTCLLLSLCHSVFKTTLSPFVIMSLCLKKYICLPPSPCYSVFKNYPVWLLILLHISCLRSAFLCCTFASSSGMKTVTGWRHDDWRGLRRTRLSAGDGPDNEKSNNLLYIRYMMNDNLFNEIDLSERLSPHFTVGEMMRSGEAVKRRIKNVPKTEGRDGEVLREEVMENLKALCACVLEPLRRRVGRVIVTSGYRSPVLNKAIHGAFDSQHLRGEAVDIHVTGAEMCRKYAAVLRQTDFDQMILEPLEATCKRWIHISYRRDGRNRHQILGEK